VVNVMKMAVVRVPCLFALLLSSILLGLCVSGICSQTEPIDPYRVGPEDQLTITVARHPEFSGSYYVASDGAFNMVAVGQVQATGKSIRELSDYIAEQLKSRLRDPEVVVTLQSPRMQRVYVLGAVNKPGLYDMKPGWRITEAVAAASGLAPGVESSDCSASLLRGKSGNRESIEMVAVFNGSSEANKAIESGDVLTIEAQETMPVYIVGKVKNPGMYRLRTDTSGVMQAITLAGGALEDAAMTKVSITHLNTKSETINLASAISDGKEQSNVKLQPGDLIVVPEETAKVAVLGYVKEPGFYPLKNGQTFSLTDTLGLAKGAEKRAELSTVAIIRTENGKQKRTIYDLTKFLKSGDAASNPVVQPGDVVYVPQTKRPDWDFVARSLTAVGIILGPLVP